MTTRLYNTHPTQGFEFYYNSKSYILQPLKGEWSISEEWADHPNATKEKPRKMPVRILRCSNPEKRCRSWIEVPDELAKIILTGEASRIDLNMDTRHHTGYVRAQGELEDSVEANYRHMLEAKEQLEKQIAEKKKELVELSGEYQSKVVEAAKHKRQNT